MSTAVDDETILEVLRSNSAPQMTTTEVANHLPVTRGTTRTRLQRLVDDDLINRETEGNNVVWWLPERGEEREAWEPDAEEEASEPEETDAEEEPEVEEGEEAEEEPEEEEEAEEEESEAEETEGEAAEDAETEDGESEDGDETEIAVTATEQSKSESEGGTEVEVEAVESEPDVETPDEATETRTAAEREEAAELSDDDEGLRVLAGVAVGLVAVILLRRLLGDDEE